MSTLPDGVVTFLLTDIEGSSPLWEERPREMAAAVARHDGIAAEVVSAHNGVLVKSRGEGDSLFCVFGRASDGVAAALELQLALSSEPWPESCPLRVRVALASGEAELRDGDYRGAVVNRCARIRSAAHGGQILLARSTCDLAGGLLPDGGDVTDLGEATLPGIRAPEHLFQLTHPRLPANFPPIRSALVPPGNLPRQLNSFVGREAELDAAAKMLESAPLVTLVGPGGSGKTRLSLETAAAARSGYPGGTWLAELAAIADEAAVLTTVAAAVSHGSAAPATLESLVERLRGEKTLLVLDNCEHLLPSCQSLAHSLLRSCPLLTIIATSREPLGVPGEATLPVSSLSAPDLHRTLSPRKVLQYESVRLFLDRARAADPSFEVSSDNAGAVAAICRHLDGIPLAIELAAARIRTLSAAQIADRLHDRFKLLKSPGTLVLPRHQTLEAAVSWSYDLLTEDEKALLRRMAAFAGGCTLDTAEAVCSDEAVDEAVDDVLDTLSRLVGKSLVTMERRPGGGVRYGMLETIRQFAGQRLESSGEADRFRERHRDHFLALAEEAEPHLQMADQKAWLDRLDAEHDNLRAALAWSVDGDYRLRIAAALWRFWYLRGFPVEGRGWLEGCLMRPSEADEVMQARAHNGTGVLAMAQGELVAAKAHFEACLGLRRATADEPGIARALNNLGLIARRMHEYPVARTYFAEALAIDREAGNEAGMAMALVNLGGVCIDDNDLESAVNLLEQSLTLYRRLGDNWALAATLHNIGAAANEMERYSAARVYLRESLEIKHTLNDPAAIALTLGSIAASETGLGNYRKAVTLVAASQNILSLTKGVSASDEAVDEAKKSLKAARMSLGEEAFGAAWASGLDKPTSEIIDSALSDNVDSQTYQ